MTRRGSVLALSLSTLLTIMVIGMSTLSLSMQAMRRAKFEGLRVDSLALAEAGAEQALRYLRTFAPDGSKQGTWRTRGLTERIAGEGTYRIVVEDGTGEEAGKLVVTSIGRAEAGNGLVQERAVRLVVKLDREDVSPWNHAVFGGVGQGGRSINGNAQIHGRVQLLGEGESYTDLDGDGKWDRGEIYTDTNRNGRYDLGEMFVDSDNDGHHDVPEPFDDVNGNGVRDPPLTATDLAGEFGGAALISNNYSGMPTVLRNAISKPETTNFKGELVETINAKLRVKHGRVSISGSATVGQPDAVGDFAAVKETVDGVYVSDGFSGTAGNSQVYSDNGTRTKYDLKGFVGFPSMIEPIVINGVHYPSYFDYLKSISLVIPFDLKIAPGVPFGPISDGEGNSLAVDASGNIYAAGVIFVMGNIHFDAQGNRKSLSCAGRATLVSVADIYIGTSLMPLIGKFPVDSALGLVARRRIEINPLGGNESMSVVAALYAQERIAVEKQAEIAGALVSSSYSFNNVPRIYHVPALPDHLPPALPGAGRIWVKTLRIDSWREVATNREPN